MMYIQPSIDLNNRSIKFSVSVDYRKQIDPIVVEIDEISGMYSKNSNLPNNFSEFSLKVCGKKCLASVF